MPIQSNIKAFTQDEPPKYTKGPKISFFCFSYFGKTLEVF